MQALILFLYTSSLCVIVRGTTAGFVALLAEPLVDGVYYTAVGAEEVVILGAKGAEEGASLVADEAVVGAEAAQSMLRKEKTRSSEQERVGSSEQERVESSEQERSEVSQSSEQEEGDAIPKQEQERSEVPRSSEQAIGEILLDFQSFTRPVEFQEKTSSIKEKFNNKLKDPLEKAIHCTKDFVKDSSRGRLPEACHGKEVNRCVDAMTALPPVAEGSFVFHLKDAWNNMCSWTTVKSAGAHSAAMIHVGLIQARLASSGEDCLKVIDRANGVVSGFRSFLAHAQLSATAECAMAKSLLHENVTSMNFTQLDHQKLYAVPSVAFPRPSLGAFVGWCSASAGILILCVGFRAHRIINVPLGVENRAFSLVTGLASPLE